MEVVKDCAGELAEDTFCQNLPNKKEFTPKSAKN